METAEEGKIPRYALLSAAAAFLVVIADYLLAFCNYTQPGTVSLLGCIRVVWLPSEIWRFSLSLHLGLIGLPFWIPGICALRVQLARTSARAAKFFYVTAIVGVCGGIFIHSSICLMAIAHHAILQGSGAAQELRALAVEVMDNMLVAILPAFLVFCTTLVLVPQLTFIITVLRGRTIFRKWSLVFNSMTFMLLGLLISQFQHHYLDWVVLAAAPAGYFALFINSAVHVYAGVRLPVK